MTEGSHRMLIADSQVHIWAPTRLSVPGPRAGTGAEAVSGGGADGSGQISRARRLTRVQVRSAVRR